MREEVPEDEWEILLEVLSAYSLVRDNIIQLLDKHNHNESDFLSLIYNYIKFISERSITVSVLLQQNLLWDAEIIMRSALEATFKVFHLCNCKSEESIIRFNELTIDLPEINSLKHSDEAKKIVSVFNLQDRARLIFLPIILEPKKEEILRAKWSGKKKKEIQRRWSFSEILKEQTNNLSSFKETFLQFSHSYRNSSHILHADETGIGIIAERSLRPEDEKRKIEKWHFCSIVINSFNYMLLCGISLSQYLKEDLNQFLDIQKNLEPTLKKMEDYHDDVLSDPAYDEFR